MSGLLKPLWGIKNVRLKKYGGRALAAIVLIAIAITTTAYVLHGRVLGVPGCRLTAEKDSAGHWLLHCKLLLVETRQDKRREGGELDFAARPENGASLTLKIASPYGQCTSDSLDVELHPGDNVEVKAIKTGADTLSVCSKPSSVKLLKPTLKQKY